MTLRIPTSYLLWFFLFGGISLAIAVFAYRGEYIQNYANSAHLARYPGIEKSSGRLPAYVLSVSGTVEYQPPGSSEWITVSADTVIMEGAKVRTQEGGEVLLSVSGSEGGEGGGASQVSLRVTEQSELSLESSTSTGEQGLDVQAKVTKGHVLTTKSSTRKGSGGEEGEEGSVEVSLVSATGDEAGTIKLKSEKPGTGPQAAEGGAREEETGKAGAEMSLLLDQSPLTGGENASLISVRFGLVAPSAESAPGYDREGLRRVVIDSLNRYVRGLDQNNVGPLSKLLLDPITQDQSPYNLANIRASVASADLTFRYLPGGGGTPVRTYSIHVEREQNQWKITSRTIR